MQTLSLIPSLKENRSESSSLDPSLSMLGAGARWTAVNGTNALYIDIYDNLIAHSDESKLDPNEYLSQRALGSQALEQSGLNVSFAGDIPTNLSAYDVVVIHAYWACEPSDEPIIRNYISNGGGVVLIEAVPCYFAHYS